MYQRRYNLLMQSLHREQAMLCMAVDKIDVCCRPPAAGMSSALQADMSP